MFRNAENNLYRSIGKFSTIKLPSDDSFVGQRDTPLATQFTAFLCSSREFVVFIESWDVNRLNGNLVIENKKVYPAKVTGLNLAVPLLESSGTVLWREGLIGIGVSYLGYRPGFGQQIMADEDRPLLQQLIPQTDLLGTGSNPAWTNSYKASFSRQLGRLMSMAFYVDPELATKYDASTSKKKKKSLNSQDYEQMPTFPNYVIYNPNAGY